MEVKRGLLGISIIFFQWLLQHNIRIQLLSLITTFQVTIRIWCLHARRKTQRPAYLPHIKHRVRVEEVQHHQAHEDGCCCGCALGSGYAIRSPADENRLWKPAHALYTCTNKQKQLDTLNKTRSTTLPVEIQGELGPLFWNAGQRAPITGLAALFWVAEGRLSARDWVLQSCGHCYVRRAAAIYKHMADYECTKNTTVTISQWFYINYITNLTRWTFKLCYLLTKWTKTKSQ